MDSSDFGQRQNEPSDPADAGPSTPWYRRPMGVAVLVSLAILIGLIVFAIIFLTGGGTSGPFPTTTPSTNSATTTTPTTTTSKHHHFPTLPWPHKTTVSSSP
jgi:hypothetical protein